jgi:hypothetical protein
MSEHICHHENAAEKLRCYDFPQRSILSPGLFIFFMTFIGSCVAWYVFEQRARSETSGTEAATACVAIGAFFLAYQQWRAARAEASLEKFYERLNITNGWMLAAQKAAVTANAPATDNLVNGLTAEQKSAAEATLKAKQAAEQAAAEYDYRMYFFSEADNLEYVIEKYKLGYIGAEHAARGADTFRIRCRQPKFRETLEKYIDAVGYQNDTRRVAWRLYKTAGSDQHAVE